MQNKKRRFGKVMYGTETGRRSGKYRNLRYESNGRKSRSYKPRETQRDPWEYEDYNYRSGLF